MGPAFDLLDSIGPLPIWERVAARVVQGDRLSLAIVELDPDAVVPEHRHENEQLGLVLQGSLSFRVGGETRDLGPGGTWRIPANAPHEARAGPDGAVVIDVFAPVRDDWRSIEADEPRTPNWPPRP